MVSTIYHLLSPFGLRPDFAIEKGISLHSICSSGRVMFLTRSLGGESTSRNPAARLSGVLAAVGGPRSLASVAFANLNSLSRTGLAVFISRYHEGLKRSCHFSSSDIVSSRASFSHTQAAFLTLKSRLKTFDRVDELFEITASSFVLASDKVSSSCFKSAFIMRQWSSSRMGMMRMTKSTWSLVRVQQTSMISTRSLTSLSACFHVEHMSMILTPRLS